MRKVALFLIISTFCFAQSERSRKFQITSGVEYRITPFNFKKQDDGIIFSPIKANYNRDSQLAGLSLNIGLDYFINKNMTIGLVQSFRYDQIFYQSSFNDEHGKTQLPVYGVILDTELQTKYYFTLKNNDKIFINLGYSFMNQNTDYSTTYNPDGNGEGSITQDFFKFNAYKIGVGYQYKNLELGIGTYIIENSDTFSDYGDSAFGIPFLKLNYNISKF